MDRMWRVQMEEIEQMQFNAFVFSRESQSEDTSDNEYTFADYADDYLI